MSGSGRKRSSKWDLKEAHRILPGELNDVGPGRPSYKEAYPSWRYGEGKYRGSRESLDTSDILDGDAGYSTKMSPGLDEWRQQKRNRSPKSSRGRSYRSRSRSRSRSRNRSPQIHLDYKYSEHKKYSEIGPTDSLKCRHKRIDSPKYFTSDTRERTSRIERCNDVSRQSSNEVSRERETDRRDTFTSYEDDRSREFHRSSDISCKFFAAGNCRNGKSCRFSHYDQTPESLENRKGGDWSGRNSLNRMDSLREGSRWSSTNVSVVGKFCKWNEDGSGDLNGLEQRSVSRITDNSRSTDNRFMGHIQNDSATESSDKGYHPFMEDNSGSGFGVSESRSGNFQVADMEISPARDYRFPSSNHIFQEESQRTSEPSKYSRHDKVPLQTFEQDIIRDLNHKQTIAVMQPLIIKTPYFQQNPNLGEDSLRGFSNDNGNTVSTSNLPPKDLNFSGYIPPGEGLLQNGQGSTTGMQPLSVLSAVDKNQQMFAPCPPKDQSFTYVGHLQPRQDGTSSKPDVVAAIKSGGISDNPLTPDIVSSEQLSNLTVSLARFLESGKQLPQLYAALTGSNSTEITQSFLLNSAVTASFSVPVSIQPNSAVGSQKHYGPVSGSMDLTQPIISNLPGEALPSSSENKSCFVGKSEILAELAPTFPGGPSGVDLFRTDGINVDVNANNHQLSGQNQNGDFNGMEYNAMTAAHERNNVQDNDVTENLEVYGKADENRKSNDGKALRAFKFALADFVKELLKPTWKESQINKEAYKTIVKKVVDKVTGTIQAGNIPQTQEKIATYLSSYKLKLSKLVQAYVEKSQKEKPAVT